MAAYTYQELKKKYEDFSYPLVHVQIGGKDFSQNKFGFQISDVEVEMTSGFEAAMATFWIYNCYDKIACAFEFDSLKKYVCMGSAVILSMGYGTRVREIFRGFISRVNFVFRQEEIPGVEITAMDIKGIMMAGNYSRQLKATCYSDSVKEILGRTAYVRLESSEIVTRQEISDTPDKRQGAPGGGESASDRTMEMVCESDYEFVVKAAKKYNYEFFSVGGTVYFRKAKSNQELLMEAAPGDGLRSYEIGYDFTGIVEKVEVRGMDAGKSKLIKASKKMQNKLSQGNKAKPLIKDSQKVYIDPTVTSKEEAGYRADYLAEDISYRLGTLEAEFIGLPELTPGRFLKVKGLGTAVSNTFYLVTVRHIMDERGYITKVTGKAAGMENEEGHS
ncbi:phage late control D family protein [uncultured Acetatifactor sp.]|mgnify:CR=1 FL=1|uniref:phage late control D family protein n=1 Tax=uncultured Acetatifactor sp. TaxID=1671927 RepID=UPI002631A7EB|nr:hypothetical protein [uncultured Acetatifactor sp.]MCI9652675.1 phage late control D family protein [Lachnospiraceae bacterium]